jgi:predicted TIM-barrel fold metal-dependent hydrolase
MQTPRDGSGVDVAPGALIDCDVHNTVPRVEALFPYLPPDWVEHVTQSAFKGAGASYYPKNAPIAARAGSAPPDGPAGSSLALLQGQILDPLGVDVAILNCLYAIDSLHNPEAAGAFARAVNDWQIAQWLDPEPRLRASLVVPVQLPELAAREIARVGDHPGFVQVLLPVRSQHPYGSRLFRPLWEAIARRGLVAGIHFGGAPGNPPFPSGWPSYYFEEYAGMAQVFQSQLASIVSEGVFDLFPGVRVALLEGGFTWLPAFMWRFDKEWRNLRRLVPWVKRAPSEYIREHVRLTIQPLDAPPTSRQLLETIEQLGSDELLLFATDYPHRHTADPLRTLLPTLPEALARKIRGENARALYGLSPRAA